MAGIYLHIPFCKQACHYCNFHFSTSLKYKDEMVAAMLRELELCKDYLGDEPVETIYFGGGTPSLLDRRDLDLFFEKIWKLFPLTPHPSPLTPEITLEANPDDLNPQKINELRQTPVNRFSIGIQSFSEADLKFMNRAHTAGEALACLQNVQQAGYENLTVDLIYGSPTTSHEQWAANLAQVFYFKIPHLSCYCLTVEEKTALAQFVKSGKAQPVDDEHAARQFGFLMEQAAAVGYEHYEISNFAQPGWHSRHNSSYWQGKKYLGIGPSAHSFDGPSRQWNVANNARYLRSIQAGEVPFEREILTPEQRYNEYVMTGLRTIWGCNLMKIKELDFGVHFLKSIAPFISEGLVERSGEVFRLTGKGKFLADGIAAELFA
ncbi:MAG: radical SAM family heme chaperone HemW [Bacteroidetes bacterium]|nr:radical SAM family heme chaperone HemW [Bacteroidota bacterium]